MTDALLARFITEGKDAKGVYVELFEQTVRFESVSDALRASDHGESAITRSLWATPPASFQGDPIRAEWEELLRLDVSTDGPAVVVS